MNIGKIISISELNIKIFLEDDVKVDIKDVLKTTVDGKEYRFEVVSVEENVATTIPFDSVIGLRRGLDVTRVGTSLEIEYSDAAIGRVFNSYGELIDSGTLDSINKRGVYDKNLGLEEININGDILWTGIKVVDFFAPLQKGFKMGLLGGAGVGKTVLIKELIIVI